MEYCLICTLIRVLSLLNMQGASSHAAAHPEDGDGEQLEPSIQQHRAELDSLAQRDPDFYAYLKETDEDLLAFGAGEAEDESEEDEGSDLSDDAAEELEVRSDA